MVRSIAVIVCAILASQPTMSKSAARGYARVVQTEARKRHFDPLTLVSIAHWESHWIASARNGQCMGLAGVCSSNYRCCQTQPSGACCLRKQACLLDGACNLREAAKAITANRAYCRRKTGRAGFRHWLASYQGLNGGSNWCGQRRASRGWVDVPVHNLTRRVMDRRRELIARCAR